MVLDEARNRHYWESVTASVAWEAERVQRIRAGAEPEPATLNWEVVTYGLVRGALGLRAVGRTDAAAEVAALARLAASTALERKSFSDSPLWLNPRFPPRLRRAGEARGSAGYLQLLFYAELLATGSARTELLSQACDHWASCGDLGVGAMRMHLDELLQTGLLAGRLEDVVEWYQRWQKGARALPVTNASLVRGQAHCCWVVAETRLGRCDAKYATAGLEYWAARSRRWYDPDPNMLTLAKVGWGCLRFSMDGQWSDLDGMLQWLRGYS